MSLELSIFRNASKNTKLHDYNEGGKMIFSIGDSGFLYYYNYDNYELNLIN